MLVKITVETDDDAKRALYLEELMETLVAMYSNDHDIHHTHKVEIGGTWLELHPVETCDHEWRTEGVRVGGKDGAPTVGLVAHPRCVKCRVWDAPPEFVASVRESER